MLFRQDHSAAHLAAIVTSSDDAIIGEDLDGHIASWNAAAERLFGYQADETIGQPIEIIIPDDRREEEVSMLARVRAGMKVDHVETIGRRKDGTTFAISVTISPIRDRQGEVIGASRIARDVSHRRRMERDALRLAAIVESSNDAIISKDLKGIIQTWNRGAERIFGYTAEEAIGRSILLIIPEDRHPEETDVLARICAGEAVEHFETVRRRKDGTLIDISLRVSPITLPSGQVIGASKIARDITEQKRLQREVAAASRAKDEFLATLSHELRTPLNTVLGYTAMLKERVLTKEQRDKAIGVIGRNAEALTKLVNDVLDTSRIVTGKLRLDLRPCDVSIVAGEALDAVRPALEAKGLVIHSIIEPEQFVQGDPDRLHQIFWNLLSNAVKFTPAGGHVTLKVGSAEGFVRITVQDTGVGLSPESLPLVFHRFWQGDPSQTREHSGLGLGLALSRHFVELHGGEISARSAGLDKGATFEVVLPQTKEEEGGRKKVLS
jgi:two-component system sensor histidine kinase VicK